MTATVVFAFDFDGVIADSAEAYARAINAVATPLSATRQMTTQLLAEMPEYRHQHSADVVGLPANCHGEFSKGLRDYFHQPQSVPLHRAMGPVLTALQDHGDVVLVSANDEEVIRLALSELQVRVEHVYGGRGKTAKAAVLGEVAERNRVIMIGDTLSDCGAAEEGGVDAIAVSWGWQSATLLTQAGVPVVHTPAELQDALMQWLQV